MATAPAIRTSVRPSEPTNSAVAPTASAVMITLSPRMRPAFWSARSPAFHHSTSRSRSSRKSSATIIRNAPPKPPIRGAAFSTFCAYCSLSPNAWLIVSEMPMPVATATIRIGKTSRMPNTAITTPTVRNIRCQKRFIRCSTVALTTALSNEIDASSAISTATIATAPSPS